MCIFCDDRFLTVSGLPESTSMSVVVEAFEKQGKVMVCCYLGARQVSLDTQVSRIGYHGLCLFSMA